MARNSCYARCNYGNTTIQFQCTPSNNEPTYIQDCMNEYNDSCGQVCNASNSELKMYCDFNKGILTSREFCEFEECRTDDEKAADPLDLYQEGPFQGDGCEPEDCEGAEDE